VRIKTAPTRRAIDKWKGKARAHLERTQVWGLELVSMLLTSSRRGRALLVPLIGVGLLFNFAAVELATLSLVGFLMVKLKFYTLVNSMFRVSGS